VLRMLHFGSKSCLAAGNPEMDLHSQRSQQLSCVQHASFCWAMSKLVPDAHKHNALHTA
jgi:hypothetical protein